METDAVRQGEGLAVLELGCGKKRYWSGSVTVDICESSNPDVVHDLNVYPYPFESNSFDIVSCVHVLEHLDDVIKTVEEIHRILKPGGRLLVEVPHFSSVHAYSDPTHKHFFASRSFDYFLEGTPVRQFDYSSARFSMLRREVITGRRRLVHRIIGPWLNRHIEFYEEHLAFIFPRHTLVFELTAIK